MARFDPSGRFIVSGGLNTGPTIVWDLETKGPVRWLDGHVKAVTSLEYVGLSFHSLL